jgi:hypothetical protein
MLAITSKATCREGPTAMRDGPYAARCTAPRHLTTRGFPGVPERAVGKTPADRPGGRRSAAAAPRTPPSL